MKFEYPLRWPHQQPRTLAAHRGFSRFPRRNRTFLREIDDLDDELRRLGATDVVISSDTKLGARGRPRHDAKAVDPGVVVYFELYVESRDEYAEFILANDNYPTRWENTRAIMKTVEALRAIERHGSTSLLERAFHGFKALPGAIEAPPPPWHEVLKVDKDAPLAEVKTSFRSLALAAHPDRGGDSEQWNAINDAYRRALQARA